MYIGFFDGSASPNPGRIGLGACICLQQTVICKSAKQGGTGTNNVAEYKALIHLLELAISLNIKTISVYGDSQLVINQVIGAWTISNERLKHLYDKVLVLRAQFTECTFNWISREKNRLADTLSKEGLTLSETKTVHSKYERTDSLSMADHIEPSIEPTLNRYYVRPLGNYKFRIDQIGHCSIVINVRSRICSCDRFRADKVCPHLNSVSRLLKKRDA